MRAVSRDRYSYGKENLPGDQMEWEERGRERMPKGMAGDPFRNSRGGGRILHRSLKNGLVEVVPEEEAEFRIPVFSECRNYPLPAPLPVGIGKFHVPPAGKCNASASLLPIDFVPAGTFPARSGIFRGSEKPRHRAGGDEQDPLFRLFLRDRGGHEVRGAPCSDRGGKGSAPRAPGSPRSRLFPFRGTGLLCGDGGDAVEREALFPGRGREAPSRDRHASAAVSTSGRDEGARHPVFRAARRGPGKGPWNEEGEGGLPRG